MKGTCLVRQTPAGVKSPFGEMLNVFMGRKIRATSATAVFTQSTPLRTFYFNRLPRRKIWLERYFGSSRVFFFNAGQQSHTNRLRKASSLAWVRWLALRTPREGFRVSAAPPGIPSWSARSIRRSRKAASEASRAPSRGSPLPAALTKQSLSGLLLSPRSKH